MTASSLSVAVDDGVQDTSVRHRRWLRSRKTKGAAIALLLAASGLTLGDSLTRGYAETRVEDVLRETLDAHGAVDVELGGWPFTVQAAGGKVPAADVTVEDVGVDGGNVSSVRLELKDIEFSISDLGSADMLATAGSGRGTAVITGPELTHHLRERGFRGKITFVGSTFVAATPDGDYSGTAADASISDQRLVVNSDEFDPLVVRIPKVIKGATYTGVTIEGGKAQFHFTFGETELGSAIP